MSAIDSELNLGRLVQNKAEYDHTSTLGRTNIKLDSPPVFIVGSPRSGTTVLGKCLAAHPRCHMGEESFFLFHLWHIFSDLHSGMNERNWAPLSTSIDESELLDLMGDFSDRIFLALIGQKSGADVYVDQTQWYGSISPFIDKLYPDARYVHIIRDGRAVTRSLRALSTLGQNWTGNDMRESANIWNTLVHNCLRIGKETPERYTEVRYEELVRDPESTIRKICHDLRLDYSNQMTLPLNTPISDPTRDVGQVLNPTDDNNKKWPDEWTEEERSIFQEIAGKLMQQLCYD